MKFDFSITALRDLEPQSQAYIAWDAGYPYKGSSLGCRVMPRGSRSIIIKYRAGGKQTTYTMGKLDPVLRRYDIPKLRARAKAIVDEAQSKGLTTTDLKAHQRSARTTIAEIGAEYLAKRQHGDIGTPYKDGGRAFEKALARASKVWGNTPVGDLREEDGTRLMRHFVEAAIAGKDRKGGGPLSRSPARGKHPGHRTAERSRGALKPLLRYANATLDVTVKLDILDFFKVKQNGAKRAVLHRDEVKALFLAVDAYEVDGSNRNGGRRLVERRDTADLVRLQFICAARPQDWRQAQWRDVFLDAAVPYVLFAEHKRKQGRDFRQLLTPAAVKILRRIQERRRSTEGDDWIFPSNKTASGHRETISGGFATIVDMAGLGHIEGLSPHVLRASRITELHDDRQWEFEKIAQFMGNSPEVVKSVYYRPRDAADELAGQIDLDSDDELFG